MSLAIGYPVQALQHSAPRFLAVGAVCALLTLTIIVLLKAAFGVTDASANAAGYVAGLVCSFALNRSWSFRHDGDPVPAAFRFLVVFAVAYVLNITTVLALVRWGVNDYLAQLAGVPVYAALSYVGYRGFAFPMARSARSGVVEPAYRLPGAWVAATAVITLASLLPWIGERPIILWDESRLANSALEMAYSGLSLVTTFDGVADHWNTKPPLVIWLMSLSIRLLDASEWAIRLPSVLAAFATAMLVLVFCARRLRGPLVGFVAVMLLFVTGGYMVYHGARSGDYDATLTLCTTGYLMAAYLYFHGREEDRRQWLALCALGIALAFMTKTVQGLIFLPALLLYAGLQRRLVQMARSWEVYACAGFIIVVCGGYYLTREMVDPGYLAMVWANDLGGRFNTVLDEHHGAPWSYLLQTHHCAWLLPGLAAAIWFAWRGEGEERRLAAFLGVVSAFYLLVISMAKTKLPWYPMPVYPLVTILMAQAAVGLLMRFARQENWSEALVQRTLVWNCVCMGALVLASNMVVAHHWGSEKTLVAVDRYSVFLRGSALRESGVTRLVVAHPGYLNSHGEYYVAPTLFYVNTLRREGRSVVIQPPTAPIPVGYAAVVACAATRDEIGARLSLQAILLEGDCGLYRVLQTSER